MENYFLNYNSLEQQRWMVGDQPRTNAFAKAIAEVVKPGDIVIDVGAGTGVLSLLAAKAQAKQVTGIERSDMAILAKKLIQSNGYENCIDIFHGYAHDFKPKEPADVIISEWLGHMAYVEGMFRSVIEVRDTCLKPGGILLPSAVDVMLAPIDDKELYFEHGPGFWSERDIHGIDFSSFTDKELQMGHVSQLLVPDRYLLSPGVAIHHLDTITAKPGDEWSSGTVKYEITRDGTLNGFVGWFQTQLSPNVLLNTAPNCPRTHWEQTYFPYCPTPVRAGQTLLLDYRMDELAGEERLMEMTLRVGTNEIKYAVI